MLRGGKPHSGPLWHAGPCSGSKATAFGAQPNETVRYASQAGHELTAPAREQVPLKADGNDAPQRMGKECQKGTSRKIFAPIAECKSATPAYAIDHAGAT